MKIKLLLISFLLMVVSSLSVQAEQLPKELRDFLFTQRNVPSVRFDGMVVYKDNTMYMPVFPSYPQTVNMVSVVKTYPENASLDSMPDMVLFNNNYALLKISKLTDGVLSVKDMKDNWPTEIKTGLLAQDMMVPKGLVLPESLSGIIGDIKIPVVGSAKTAAVLSKQGAPLPTGLIMKANRVENVPKDLKNKLFFVNNFQTEYLEVFSSTVSEPLYSLKTSGVIADVKPFSDGQFLLVASKNLKNVDVVDVANEYVIKNIDLTSYPTEIVIDDFNKKAYVASSEDESLSIIDLNSMTMKEKIQLVGAPHKLALSNDGKFLAYVDIQTSNIFVLNLTGEYENKLITNFPNVTKMLLENDELYMISRTNPELRIVSFDLLQEGKISKSKRQLKKEAISAKEAEKDSDSFVSDLVTDYGALSTNDLNGNTDEKQKMYSTSIKGYAVGIKPIDVVKKNNTVYVLCAGDNAVYSYNIDSQQMTTTTLPVSGFSKAFTPVPNSNLAVITNVSDLKYVVYDMKNNQVVQTLPLSDYINMITILERRNGR